jgi:hypothetical protein
VGGSGSISCRLTPVSQTANLPRPMKTPILAEICSLVDGCLNPLKSGDM